MRKLPMHAVYQAREYQVVRITNSARVEHRLGRQSGLGVYGSLA